MGHDRRVNELSERQKWLRARVGKTLYRPDNGCDCPVCISVLNQGLTISDEYHADYLADTESDYSASGWPMQYFDTKEEADQFQKENPPSKKGHP